MKTNIPSIVYVGEDTLVDRNGIAKRDSEFVHGILWVLVRGRRPMIVGPGEILDDPMALESLGPARIKQLLASGRAVLAETDQPNLADIRNHVEALGPAEREALIANREEAERASATWAAMAEADIRMGYRDEGGNLTSRGRMRMAQISASSDNARQREPE